MSDNTVDLMSNSEGKTLPTSIMGTSPNPHLPSPGRNHLKLEIIPLSNDSNSKRVSRNSLEEETSSSGSLEAFFYQILAEKLIASRYPCPFTS